jgi:hypothetical protein
MSRTMAVSGAGPAGHAPPAAYRRAGAVLAAEWIKLRSLRSMLLTSLLARSRPSGWRTWRSRTTRRAGRT